MRSRGLILPFVLLASFALVVSSCSSVLPDKPTVGRSVGDEGPVWDVEEAILRTETIEASLDNGLTRGQAVCMIDAMMTYNGYTLAELDGIDFTTETGNAVLGDKAVHLADALVTCGPPPRERLAVQIPGTFSAPLSHATESECVINSYVEAWRTEYVDAFGVSKSADADPVIPNVDDKIASIITGCEAGPALILGASHEGHFETRALATLEWECLAAELTADQFLPAFPFPEEPGDALARMGRDVAHDADFCREWIGAANDEERAEVESRYR
ncbi:MAG: hypothetical protein ACI9C1_000062 [Candidatus Aldehydirespiratoraceae bacterium]|jgi:hypothetical protein